MLRLSHVWYLRQACTFLIVSYHTWVHIHTGTYLLLHTRTNLLAFRATSNRSFLNPQSKSKGLPFFSSPIDLTIKRNSYSLPDSAAWSPAIFSTTPTHSSVLSLSCGARFTAPSRTLSTTPARGTLIPPSPFRANPITPHPCVAIACR